MELLEMIKEFQKNDHSHFDEFYALTNRQVFFSAYTILKDHDLSQDVMQETYVKFLNNVHEYKSHCNVYAYLSTIARNLSINIYNKQKMHVEDDEPLNYLGQKDEYQEANITMILNLLETQVEREIVMYHAIFDYKFKDIAKIVNRPLGTVLWIYNKSIKILKERLKGIYE